MKYGASSKLVLIFAAALLAFLRFAKGQSSNEEEVKRVYKQLIDAENRHDVDAVRALVWNSPSTLFVAKAPVGWHGYWGIDDVTDERFLRNIEGYLIELVCNVESIEEVN